MDLPPYTIRSNSKAKHLTIRIRDGKIIVTKPSSITIPYLENFLMRKLDWINKHLSKSLKIIPRLSKKDYQDHKIKALVLAKDRLDLFNKHYNFAYNKITVKDQKTRWGSCSRKGNINFNYKIALIPEYLADYVIVHELCHLGQFDHSHKFWNLVAETIPDYMERRKELKRISL
jgi:predicted metal-dependent hydrolase